MALCSCSDRYTMPDHSIPFSSNICLHIYDENEDEEIYKLSDDDDYSITLTVDQKYVFNLYLVPSHGTDFGNKDVSFEYDEEYVNIEESEKEQYFYFVGLKETEETTVIIHHDYVFESKTMKIALVTPNIDSE